MKIRYWICDNGWREVFSSEEYYAFDGDKTITSAMGLGWEMLMATLVSYRK